MSQRNFGQHGRGEEGGWSGVPEWGSQPRGEGFQSHQSSNYNEFEQTGQLEGQEFNQGFPNQQGFQQPRGQWGNPSGAFQDNPRNYQNAPYSEQEFSQGNSFGNQGGFQEPYGDNFGGQSTGYPQDVHNAPHKDKKWSPLAIGLTIGVIVVLIFGVMIFITSRSKSNSTDGLKAKVEQTTKAVDKGTAKEKSKDSDRIFSADGSSSEVKKSTEEKEKPKETSENLGGSQDKTQTNQPTQNLDSAKVSSEVLVAKGVVKGLHLEGTSDLAASYKATLSVGSATLSVSLTYDLASQLKVGDSVTVKYRKLADVDKVVVESVSK